MFGLVSCLFVCLFVCLPVALVSVVHRDNICCLQAKPVDATKWWRRMKVTHKGDISLRSRKLHWWVFTLDLQGEINPLTKTKDISFRVATAWDVSSGRYQNKKKIQLTDGIEARVHWNVSYDLPEVSGHFSSKNDATVNDMQASLGYAHAEISKVDVSIWPRNLSIPKSRRVLLEGSQHDSDNLGDSSDGHKQWILQNFIKEFRKSK
jgi:hypothetical protein